MKSGGDPSITPAIATLIGLSAAGAMSGVGAGIAGSMEADAQKEAAAEQAKGPIRGGTDRAGNKGSVGLSGLPDISTMSKIGQASNPMRQPVYGSLGMSANNAPIDLAKLFQPQQFGKGFGNSYNLPNAPKRFM